MAFFIEFSYHQKNAIAFFLLLLWNDFICFSLSSYSRPLFRCVYNSIFRIVRCGNIVIRMVRLEGVFFHYFKIIHSIFEGLAMDLSQSYCCLLLSIAFKIKAEKNVGVSECQKQQTPQWPISYCLYICRYCSLFTPNIVIRNRKYNCIANRIR